MIAPIEKSIAPNLERALEDVHRRIRFRRTAQYITFNNEHPNAIITMEPVHKDPKLSPRTLAKIAVFQENDTLAQFILEQGSK